LRQRAYALLASTVWRVLGGGLLVFAAALLVALAGYDATDPSFDVATGKDAANWLGRTGSFTADFMLRFWGLAALGFAAAISAWAWQMLSRAMPPRRFVWRAAALFFGLLFCACGLGALPLFGSFPSGAGGIPGHLSWTALG
jgi:S-DNA-T family DNA segregation ATPase FtsK/SpoIIIE